MYNEAKLIGNLGNDPEIKTTNSGKKVANFSLATNKKVNGESVTQWHNIVVWERLAEIAEKYLQKGARVLVSGEIQYRKYETKEGQTRYVTEINGYQLLMLGDNKAPASQEQKHIEETVGEDLPF